MKIEEQKIILDVDTGSDDALAILLAIKSRRFEILGITTVAGNTNLRQVTINTLKVLNLTGRLDIPVFGGSPEPLNGKGRRAKTHGKDGLCDVMLPLPNKKAQKLLAKEFILREVFKFPQKIAIIATGPLTNIAQILKEKTVLKRKIKRIFIMGGALDTLGNVTPFAEFNFFNDPEAVRIIFKSGIPITLIPLDVTNKVLIKKKWIVRNYGKTKDPIVKFITELVKNHCKLTKKNWFRLHDPLTVGAAINKYFVKTKKEKLSIITQGQERGRVIKDSKGSKVELAFNVNTKAFLDFFEKLLLK